MVLALYENGRLSYTGLISVPSSNLLAAHLYSRARHTDSLTGKEWTGGGGAGDNSEKVVCPLPLYHLLTASLYKSFPSVCLICFFEYRWDDCVPMEIRPMLMVWRLKFVPSARCFSCEDAHILVFWTPPTLLRKPAVSFRLTRHGWISWRVCKTVSHRLKFLFSLSFSTSFAVILATNGWKGNRNGYSSTKGLQKTFSHLGNGLLRTQVHVVETGRHKSLKNAPRLSSCLYKSL